MKFNTKIPKEISVHDISFVLAQDPDCCESSNNDCQELEITVRNNGVGNFVTIKTERWAFDGDGTEDWFLDLIKEICK